MAITYRDRFCLVGDNDGNREWSLNQFLLFAIECLLFERAKDGYTRAGSVPLSLSDKLSNDALEICDVSWSPSLLAIAYKIGKLQLMPG